MWHQLIDDIGCFFNRFSLGFQIQRFLDQDGLAKRGCQCIDYDDLHFRIGFHNLIGYDLDIAAAAT